MPNFEPPSDSESLEQAATRCFLTTILAVTRNMAESYPSVGIALQRRWARAPQRIGFDPSPAALETARRAFERDIDNFFEFTGAYYREAIPLVQAVADCGAETADAVLERVAAHSVLLETLSESLSTIADLDVPEPARAALDHRAEGLRTCARQVELQILPLVTRLRNLIQDCEALVSRTRQVPVVDASSGLLNEIGFLRDLERRLDAQTVRCAVRLRLNVALPDGSPCPEQVFEDVKALISGPILEQFRANDSVGVIGRTVGILFDGTPDQARSRLKDIERRLSGTYNAGKFRVTLAVEMEVFEPGSDLLEIFSTQPASPPAEQTAAK